MPTLAFLSTLFPALRGVCREPEVGRMAFRHNNKRSIYPGTGGSFVMMISKVRLSKSQADVKFINAALLSLKQIMVVSPVTFASAKLP